MMNKLFQKISLISVFLGIIIVFFILWSRVIKIRLPKTIYDFSNIYYLIEFVGLNIMIHIILIIINVKQLYDNDIKNNQNYLYNIIKNIPSIEPIINLLFQFNKYILESPKILYEFIFQIINIAHILEKPFLALSNYIENSSKTIYLWLIYITFNILPRIYVAFIFLFEVFITKNIDYFYKSLWLLLIPLIYNVLLWILGDLSDKNTYYANAHVNIITKNDRYIFQFRDKVPPIQDPIDFIARNKDTKLLQWFVYMYTTYRDIKWFVYNLELIKKKVIHYQTITLSLLYLIGWFYIIYINLKLWL